MHASKTIKGNQEQVFSLILCPDVLNWQNVNCFKNTDALTFSKPGSIRVREISSYMELLSILGSLECFHCKWGSQSYFSGKSRIWCYLFFLSPRTPPVIQICVCFLWCEVCQWSALSSADPLARECLEVFAWLVKEKKRKKRKIKWMCEINHLEKSGSLAPPVSPSPYILHSQILFYSSSKWRFWVSHHMAECVKAKHSMLTVRTREGCQGPAGRPRIKLCQDREGM